jgi:hypothetical protein
VALEKPKPRCDAPSHSLKDSNASLKLKIMEKEGIGVRSVTRNSSGVEGHARAPWWGLGWVTIIHTDLHKLDNKLVSA